ncbi:flagellar hook-associated protein FlgK [Rubrivirga sp. IMCC45206]|uniref:flagellar hook-associated protein FlgK n=1 Tax=Rubrivirga sp. IMCC45206 TaxID=3391614 RepID=UPI00398F926A
MSLTSLFSTARQSLLASQAGTNATANNIANVETPGYTRRSATLQATPRQRGGVQIQALPGAGDGVHVSGFDRTRNGLLDDAVRRGRAGSDGAGEGALLLSAVENAVGSDGTRLLDPLRAFFSAWSSVADAPAELAPRDALLSEGQRLGQTLRMVDAGLAGLEASAETGLAATVERANSLLAEVAELNTVIRTAQSQGGQDLDALDRRDVLLDELAGIAPFSARAQPEGDVTLSLDGMVVVQEGTPLPLRVVGPPEEPTTALFATGSSRPIGLGGIESGVLGAQLDTIGRVIPETRAALDGLVNTLVTRVNAAQESGTGLDGSTGQPFFDPAGTTAATLSLASGLTAESVAAGTSGPGDGSTAEAINGIGEGLDATASRLLAGVGTEVRRATAASEANASLTAYAEALRSGVSDVSLDEEMTNLIKFQQSYAASARVLETATQMFDTLLAM